MLLRIKMMGGIVKGGMSGGTDSGGSEAGGEGGSDMKQGG
jgi:hypothetical protein